MDILKALFKSDLEDQLPEGWSDSSNISFSGELADSSSGIQPTVSVNAGDAKEGEKLDTFSQRKINWYKVNYQDLEILREGNGSVHGLNAWEALLQFKIGDHHVKQRQIFIETSRKILVCTALAAVDDFKKNEVNFNSILSSLAEVIE